MLRFSSSKFGNPLLPETLFHLFDVISLEALCINVRGTNGNGVSRPEHVSKLGLGTRNNMGGAKKRGYRKPTFNQ